VIAYRAQSGSRSLCAFTNASQLTNSSIPLNHCHISSRGPNDAPIKSVIMASASKDLDARLLEFASGDGLPEKIGWPELRGFLRGANVDISTRTKDEWIAYAENLKRNYQTRLQVEQDILLRAARDEEDPGEITWITLQCYLKGAMVDIAVHAAEEWMKLLDIARQTVQEEKAETSRKRSTSSTQVESEGESDTDSGYQSDTAQDKVRLQSALEIIRI
jgi:hypothetical protein